MKNLFALGLVALSLGSVACSAAEDLNPLPTSDGRCDFRPKKPQCTDLRNYKAAVPASTVLKGICVEGTADDSKCSTEGMLGGCQTDNASGSRQTNWYYASEKYKTVDDVKAECASQKADFVDPS